MLDLDITLRRKAFTLRIAQEIHNDVLGVFGPSGSGKSTLLSVLAGLEPSAVGRVVLDGNVLQDSAKGVFVPPEQRRIGLAFQANHLFPHLNVERNLRYGRPRRDSRDGPQLEDVTNLLELGGLLPRRIGELSGGEAKRVALGRAILSRPRVLLLDEPLAGLDEALRCQILPYLRRLREAFSIPMLIVSHRLEEILELTDCMMVLRDGAVLGQGRFAELTCRKALLGVLHHLGLRSVLRLRVRQVRPEQGVTLCEPAEGWSPTMASWDAPLEIRVPLTDAQPGDSLHAMLSAGDVVLARQPVDGVSMQNQIPGRIEHITVLPERCTCLIDIGTELLAEVTHDAVRRLDLAAGRDVWCLFKTQALTLLR